MRGVVPSRSRWMAFRVEPLGSLSRAARGATLSARMVGGGLDPPDGAGDTLRQGAFPADDPGGTSGTCGPPRICRDRELSTASERGSASLRNSTWRARLSRRRFRRVEMAPAQRAGAIDARRTCFRFAASRALAGGRHSIPAGEPAIHARLSDGGAGRGARAQTRGRTSALSLEQASFVVHAIREARRSCRARVSGETRSARWHLPGGTLAAPRQTESRLLRLVELLFR